MSRPRPAPKHIPLWQLALLGVVRAFQGLVTHPLRRMWRSTEAIDAYALNHLTSIAGDALLAVSLADSVFFSLPVGESRVRVALYLGLTMLPLALAGPFIVPLLDRAGPRRSVTFGAAAARAVLALLLAPRMGELALFPLALLMLACAKVHSVAKNGLTMAYANREEGLLRANARLGRIAVAGADRGRADRLDRPAGGRDLQPDLRRRDRLRRVRGPGPAAPDPQVEPSRSTQPLRGGWSRGRLPTLAMPALGAIGLRAAGGFLLFLLAFSLRSAEVPATWFAVAGAAGITGGFLADLLAPALPSRLREEAVVIACLGSAAVGALLAWRLAGARPARALRVDGRRRDRVRAAGPAGLDPARRPGGRPRERRRPLRGAVPGVVGGRPRSSRRSSRSRSAPGSSCSRCSTWRSSPSTGGGGGSA